MTNTATKNPDTPYTDVETIGLEASLVRPSSTEVAPPCYRMCIYSRIFRNRTLSSTSSTSDSMYSHTSPTLPAHAQDVSKVVHFFLKVVTLLNSRKENVDCPLDFLENEGVDGQQKVRRRFVKLLKKTLYCICHLSVYPTEQPNYFSRR